jgi:hypothetical protein
MNLLNFAPALWSRAMSIRILMLASVMLIAGCKGMPTRTDAARPSAAPAPSKVEQVTDLSAITTALAAAGSRKTLLVIDIDDTLLTSTGFFGSDSWYEWEKSLPEEQKVACKFDLIALNYEAGTQVLTQPDAPALVNALTVDRILLTSRGANYRAGTIRELKQYGYQLPAPLGGPARGAMWTWTDPESQRQVPVSYDSGVFMTTGANKGLVLLDLLNDRGLTYDHIILADDGRRNIDNMQAALAKANISYHGLWYTRIDKTVSDDDKKQGHAGLAAWKSLLQTVYPERWARFEQKQCFN